MQPRVCSFISFILTRRCEIEFPSVQLIWSARLVLRSHITFSARSHAGFFNEFGHEWFLPFCWSCTVLKGWQWPGQAQLGGCLYIICQDDMLLKNAQAGDQKELPPLFFFFFFFISLFFFLFFLYPDFPFGGETKLRRSVDAVFYLFFPFFLCCYKSLDHTDPELGWKIQ